MNVDCGLTHNTEDKIRTTLKERFPGEQSAIENIEFGAIER
jgi:hypothetical protein